MEVQHQKAFLPPLLPHGLKRSADDELQREQRLAKRFNLLSLENASRITRSLQPQKSPSKARNCRRERERNAGNEDLMQLDNTKDRVFISNLDDELSDAESEEDKVIFIPDIEKKLTRIPQSVLMATETPASSSQEMVLYSVPTSLSVPLEQDNVRKAIIETRARAREQQAREALYQNTLNSDPYPLGAPSTTDLPMDTAMEIDEDVDAMDIG
ncbi:MAG: hypothetical protein M1829_001084 [Trizodia sp. TS-e1964]|nr:MAG: hypothetical protein M1829_001084 [Trizodia sp. TS-e1964]